MGILVIYVYPMLSLMDFLMDNEETSNKLYTHSDEKKISEIKRDLFLLGRMVCSHGESNSSWQLSVLLLRFSTTTITNNSIAFA